MNFKLATNKDIPSLKQIWSICFNEPQEAIDLFFENKFNNKNCVVLEVENKIVSALYMLDATIVLNDKIYPCYYLYAAGTLPSYRGLKYMTQLINYSNDLAFKNGKDFSFLLPASKSLYGYYGKLGYKRFFKQKIVVLQNEDMKKYKVSFKKEEISLDSVNNLRYNFLLDKEGSIMWSKESIKYAILINEAYNGKTVFAKEGYAICIPQDSENLIITELISSNSSFDNLIGAIYSNFPSYDYYHFRLPAFDNHFKNGKNIDFGMIKVLNKNINLNDKSNPYLGLTLD